MTLFTWVISTKIAHGLSIKVKSVNDSHLLGIRPMQNDRSETTLYALHPKR